MRLRGLGWALALLLPEAVALAQESSWTPVSGADELRDFMSGLIAERELPNGTISRGEYRADGTGVLFSWGAAIPRTWSIEGDDSICVTAERMTRCYRYERSTTEPDLYRAGGRETGEWTEFRVVDGRAESSASPREIGKEGGAATASADEMAAELSNPNTAVASLTLKNQFRTFTGELPDADGQSSYTLLFQPSLPFVLGSGDKILWRPAVPVLVGQPIPGPSSGDFESKSGLGDIAFDLAYAPKLKSSGLLFAVGMITSLPTATDETLGTDRWTLGPEILLGLMRKWGILGIFPNHQWGVAGSGERQVDVTTIQPIFTYLPGGGWNIGTGPLVTYDWETEQWTVPLQVNLGRTVVWKGRPWKLSLEVNYFIEQPDALGPEWMVGLNVAPVVKNAIAGWFR